jgi:GxxExxY protein
MIDGVADGTGAVIGAFYAVYNTLRYGFLESVYASALEVEFQERGIHYIREMPLVVDYKGRAVGSYRADFFVNGRLVVEQKATSKITQADQRQLLHYLRATNQEIGLLLHFGEKAQFHRVIHSREE